MSKVIIRAQRSKAQLGREIFLPFHDDSVEALRSKISTEEKLWEVHLGKQREPVVFDIQARYTPALKRLKELKGASLSAFAEACTYEQMLESGAGGHEHLRQPLEMLPVIKAVKERMIARLNKEDCATIESGIAANFNKHRFKPQVVAVEGPKTEYELVKGRQGRLHLQIKKGNTTS
jgi:hypothetical protein